jgi:hypothetical protein
MKRGPSYAMKLSTTRMNVATLAFAIGLSLLPGSKAEAGRKLTLPPIHLHSIHGGAKSDASGGTSCISAGLFNVAPNPDNGAGVAVALHTVAFSFRNLSPIDQTVRLVIEPGTLVESFKSSTNNTPIPDATGPTAAINSASQAAVVVPGNATRRIEVQLICNPNFCEINLNGATIAGQGGATLPGGACAGSVTCLSVRSSSTMHILVDQDRGAILGSIATASHRGCGYIDNNLIPPPSFQLNGGRPF